MQKTYLPISPDEQWLKKLLLWANQQYPFVSYFDPCGYSYPHDGFKRVLLAGSTSLSWQEVHQFPGEKAGILGYDLKNQFEKLSSQNPVWVDCPETLFFVPELKIDFEGNGITIHHHSPLKILKSIENQPLPPEQKAQGIIRPMTSKQRYLDNVKHIQNHILEGDIYEMNYCMAFRMEFEVFDPISTYLDLRHNSPMPFSTFFKAENQYLLGASPERFLKKEGNTLIAQPIKGTIRRGTTKEEDISLQRQLQHSEKEKAENLMIVDLMRNDLASISHTGSVKVEELFGVYPFRQVFQLISTVSSTVSENITFDKIMSRTFPMGSMTGAPKIKCMELIEKYEDFKRGWFSGAVGYIDEKGDFDLSVVIRSIGADSKSQKLYFAQFHYL